VLGSAVAIRAVATRPSPVRRRYVDKRGTGRP
jgi:hypothetical protein